MFDHMTMDDLVLAYNAEPKPNAYGAELLRRVNAEDRAVFGMSAEALRR